MFLMVRQLPAPATHELDYMKTVKTNSIALQAPYRRLLLRVAVNKEEIPHKAHQPTTVPVEEAVIQAFSHR